MNKKDIFEFDPNLNNGLANYKKLVEKYTDEAGFVNWREVAVDILEAPEKYYGLDESMAEDLIYEEWKIGPENLEKILSNKKIFPKLPGIYSPGLDFLFENQYEYFVFENLDRFDLKPNKEFAEYLLNIDCERGNVFLKVLDKFPKDILKDPDIIGEFFRRHETVQFLLNNLDLFGLSLEMSKGILDALLVNGHYGLAAQFLIKNKDKIGFKDQQELHEYISSFCRSFIRNKLVLKSVTPHILDAFKLNYDDLDTDIQKALGVYRENAHEEKIEEEEEIDDDIDDIPF